VELEGKTILSVSQGDYAIVADGVLKYLDAYNDGLGWD